MQTKDEIASFKWSRIFGLTIIASFVGAAFGNYVSESGGGFFGGPLIHPATIHTLSFGATAFAISFIAVFPLRSKRDVIILSRWMFGILMIIALYVGSFPISKYLFFKGEDKAEAYFEERILQVASIEECEYLDEGLKNSYYLFEIHWKKCIRLFPSSDENISKCVQQIPSWIDEATSEKYRQNSIQRKNDFCTGAEERQSADKRLYNEVLYERRQRVKTIGECATLGDGVNIQTVGDQTKKAHWEACITETLHSEADYMECLQQKPSWFTLQDSGHFGREGICTVWYRINVTSLEPSS